MDATATPTATGTEEEVAVRYFEAVGRRDISAMLACWHPAATEFIAGVGELRVPEDYVPYFEELFAGFPDMASEVVDVVAGPGRAAVHWRSPATHLGPYRGLRPTGKRVEMRGLDLLRVEDGLIRRNDAYYDGLGLAEQLGVLPPFGTAQYRALFGAVNLANAARRELSKRRRR